MTAAHRADEWAALEKDALDGNEPAVRLVVSALRSYRRLALELRSNAADYAGEASVRIETIDSSHLEGR
jgi:hypothetical protein